MIFLFLCLIHFTKHTVFQIHICSDKWQNVLPFIDWVILCSVYTTFTLSTHPLMSSNVVSMPWLFWIILKWRWEFLSTWTDDLISFGYILIRGSAVSHNIFIFSVFRSIYVFFPPKGYISLPSTTEVKEVSFLPTVANIAISGLLDSNFPERGGAVLFHDEFELHVCH